MAKCISHSKANALEVVVNMDGASLNKYQIKAKSLYRQCMKMQENKSIFCHFVLRDGDGAKFV